MTPRTGLDNVNVRVSLDQSAIKAFCARWKLKELALFGSVLREDFTPESDVDVLVSLTDDAGWDLWDLLQMRDELAALFGRQVDLVTKGGLRNPFRRHEILSTRRVIYAA